MLPTTIVLFDFLGNVRSSSVRPQRWLSDLLAFLPNLSRIHLLRTASQARQQPTNRGPEPSHVGQPKTVAATDAAPTAVQSVGAIAVQLQDGAGAHTGPRPADGGPAGDEGQLGTSFIYLLTCRHLCRLSCFWFLWIDLYHWVCDVLTRAFFICHTHLLETYLSFK